MRVHDQLPFPVLGFIGLGTCGLCLFAASFALPELSQFWIGVAILCAAVGIGYYAGFPPKRRVVDFDTPEPNTDDAVRVFERAAPKVRDEEGVFTVPIAEFMDTKRVIGDMLRAVSRSSPLKRQLDMNRARVSGVPYVPGEDFKSLPPEKFDGTAEEAVDAYLRNTPLRDLFDREVPISFDDATRFRHTFIVAPTGAGKTNLLQHFLAHDFERVERGECSVIVIDSTGDLLPELTRLERFRGGDKLVLADTNDVAFPLALSLFDFGLRAVSEENRAAFRNSATSLISYLFRALLDMELTGHQTTALSFAIEVLIDAGDANLEDLTALMKPGGSLKYARVIERMRPAVQAYFRDTFDNPKNEVHKRKQEVAARLDGLLARAELSNMFAARKTRLNFFEEMNQPKVIFINIPKPLLQKEGVEIFGRYFLAMILLAAERRVDIPERKRLPCFLYMDEAQNFLYRDEKIAELLDGVRKFKVGATILTQRVGEFQERVLDAIVGNAATTFASQIVDPAASRFARFMGTSADFLTHQPKYHFALKTPDMRRAVSVPILEAKLFKQPRMDRQEYDRLRVIMRERYAFSAPAAQAAPEETIAAMLSTDDEPPRSAAEVGEPPVPTTPKPRKKLGR